MLPAAVALYVVAAGRLLFLIMRELRRDLNEILERDMKRRGKEDE